MNPSYMASMKAVSTLYLNAFLGIEPKPVVKKEKETSINGRAFAPGHGVQQEVSSEEKEANIRAHLDKLAAEAKARYDANPYDALTPAESYEVPEKTKCPTIGEIAAERHRGHQEYIDRQIALNRTTLVEPEVDETSTKEEVLKALHETHAAYIERRIKLNRKEFVERNMPIGYPVSDLITLRDEEQARREAAANAVIHTGEGMNIENAQANSGVPWHQQG